MMNDEHNRDAEHASEAQPGAQPASSEPREHERRQHRRGAPADGAGPGDDARDFWREWRAERPKRALDVPVSPKQIDALREFFYKNFGTWPEQHWIFGGRRFSPWHQGMASFNPFVANLLSKGGGLLPLYVLHLVAQQPRYGNEIMDLLTKRTNGQWVSNPGAIYPLLTLLEREGFVTGEWEDPDKRTVRIYTITPSGHDEVTRIKSIVAPKLAETVTILQELLDDLQGSQAAASGDTAPESQDTTLTDKEIHI